MVQGSTPTTSDTNCAQCGSGSFRGPHTSPSIISDVSWRRLESSRPIEFNDVFYTELAPNTMGPTDSKTRWLTKCAWRGPVEFHAWSPEGRACSSSRRSPEYSSAIRRPRVKFQRTPAKRIRSPAEKRGHPHCTSRLTQPPMCTCCRCRLYTDPRRSQSGYEHSAHNNLHNSTPKNKQDPVRHGLC